MAASTPGAGSDFSVARMSSSGDEWSVCSAPSTDSSHSLHSPDARFAFRTPHGMMQRAACGGLLSNASDRYEHLLSPGQASGYACAALPSAINHAMAFPTLEPDISSIREAAEAAILYGIMQAESVEAATDSARLHTAWTANGQAYLPCIDEHDNDDDDVEAEGAGLYSDDDSDDDDMLPGLTMTGTLVWCLVLQIPSALSHLIPFFSFSRPAAPMCSFVCSPYGGAGAGRLQDLGCCAENISRVVSRRPRACAFQCGNPKFDQHLSCINTKYMPADSSMGPGPMRNYQNYNRGGFPCSFRGVGNL